MKKNFLLLILSWFSALAGFAQSAQTFTSSTPEDAGFSTERLKRIDRCYQEMIDKGIAPNAVAFVARGGKVVYNKAFGFKNLSSKEALKKDDIFRIASQTKAITTTALMILFEEGKFVLDDPISKYIPAFKNPKVLESFNEKTLEYTTRPAKNEITIRRLLSHTAGITYDHPLFKRPEFQVPNFTSVKKETLAEVIPKIAARPLVSEPGTKFEYGLNTDIIGYLVEVLSGTTLEKFIQTRILQPLDMKDTYFFLPKEKEGRLVELYTKSAGDSKLKLHVDEVLRNYSKTGARTYFSGGAGLVSTIEDYAKFCQMILNKGTFNNHRILGRKTVEMMSSNQIDSLEVWDRQDKFGLGFQIITERSRYGDNASVGSLTWGGLFCSEYTIDPKEDLIMLVFTNVQPYAHYGEFVRKFRTLVYQALDK